MGPVESLDRAFAIVRGVGWPLVARAWLGGGVVAAALMLAYYLEAIEGAGALRFALAAGLLAAWGARALLLTGAARIAIATLWQGQVAVEKPVPTDILRTAAAVLAGLWTWLWIPLGALWLGPVALLFVPALALRGAVAPGWIARAGTQRGGGLPAFVRAAEDAGGRRGAGVVVELLLLAGTGLLAMNVFGVFAVGVLVARSFLGLDVALVESFLSPENGFVSLGVASASAVALEPVRVGWSVIAHTSARARREGFELRAVVDRAIETARRGARGSRAAVVVLALLAAGAEAGAQEAVVPAKPASGLDVPAVGAAPATEAEIEVDEPASGLGVSASEAAPATEAESGAPIAPADPLAEYAPTPRDREVQAEVQRILERGEFREIEDVRSQSLRELLRRFLDWLEDVVDLPDFDADPDPTPSGVPFRLPDADVFLFVGLSMLVGVLGYFLVTRARVERSDVVADAGGEGGPSDDPRDRSPASHLDEASLLASEGRHRDALRSLYLATLVSLDRRRAITFDPSRTNWHYLRQLAPGPTRERFARFTRLFDHKWYGDEPTYASDYDHARALADALCDSRAREVAAR